MSWTCFKLQMYGIQQSSIDAFVMTKGNFVMNYDKPFKVAIIGDQGAAAKCNGSQILTDSL